MSKTSASQALQDLAKVRTELSAYCEDIYAARAQVSEHRSSIDFQLLAFLVHVGLLDADRVWSMLPSTLWKSKQIEDIWALDPQVVADEDSARASKASAAATAAKKVDDLEFLRVVLPKKLNEKHTAALQL